MIPSLTAIALAGLALPQLSTAIPLVGSSEQHLPVLKKAASAIHNLRARAKSSDEPSADLTIGTYQGFTNNSVDYFLGLPYAEPPTGNLRFKRAQTPQAKKGTQYAKEWPTPCAQDSDSSEDCLYLNVARPSGVSQDTKLPVIVWIHGGGFYNGASAWYNPEPIIEQSVAINKPIMYVSLNYRLNAFGFTFHPEVTAPEDSNAGLTDQLQAFQFLQDNLAALGGDPTKVTIWGQSAGAFSTEAHTLYASNTSSLFRASITDSSYLLSARPADFSGALFPSKRETDSFWAVAGQAGCGSKDKTGAKQAYDCLMGLSYGSLQSAVQTVMGYGTAHWAPVIDIRNGSYLSEPPLSRLENGAYNNIATIIGCNKDDGSYFAPGSIWDDSGILSQIQSLTEGASKSDQILKAYTSDPSNEGVSATEISWQVATDWNFLVDRRHVSDTLAKTNNATFTYLFSQPPPNSGSGAYHSAELEFLFKTWRRLGGVDNPEQFDGLAKQMMSYWINFVHDLNPNGQELAVWPPASNHTMDFIAGNSHAILDNFRRSEVEVITAHGNWLATAPK